MTKGLLIGGGLYVLLALWAKSKAEAAGLPVLPVTQYLADPAGTLKIATTL